MNIKTKEAILAQVDALQEELIQMVVNMVQIPSVNPTYAGMDYATTLGGESKVNEFLEPIMASMGLKTDLFEAEKGRANLVGVCQGTGGGNSLIFNGHIDVVPAGDENAWTETQPFSGEIRDGRIWGRGTGDMKSGNAAAIIALKAILKAGFQPKGDVILETVVGEENMNTEAGTGAVIQRGYTADAAVCVEPSGPPYPLGLILASPSVTYMKCTIKGKAVHASMRDETFRPGGGGAVVGVSSIDKAAIIYNGLRELEERWGQTKNHPLFTRPGHFTIHPGVVTGGPNGAFVISDVSTIEYAIWAPPQESLEEIKQEIEEAITVYAATDPWLKDNPPKVEWLLFWPGFDVPVDAPISLAVAQAYKEAMGKPVDIYGFAAVDDGAFLNLAGIPCVTMGPGNLQVCHAANEYVEINEVVNAAKIYALLIAEWCGI